MARPVRTEHGGAKNGGGYWGSRAEAKVRSKRARREADKVVAALEDSCREDRVVE